MALSMSAALLRWAARRPLWAQVSPGALARPCSTAAAPETPKEQPEFDTVSRYKDKPWEYLETEEYHATYGDKPVWFGYRRNHKGSVPPQRTRKACLRKGKRVGNPCPICRDRNLFLDFRNVKLLDQFICPHSGAIYHPTYTGVCMKQHKALSRAVEQARDRGLLWPPVPYVAAPAAAKKGNVGPKRLTRGQNGRREDKRGQYGAKMADTRPEGPTQRRNGRCGAKMVDRKTKWLMRGQNGRHKDKRVVTSQNGQ
ncbi:28S ribosomal protein S18b, mitochondrial [Nothoprocta perdicaria]|uniref:28S ribosomal protein S18b, mitochondrial n=1 Tax=Nothoprocta perdicaria TaxID=30464 RepID=UPI000E1B5FF3|nr:28S ribosomal protein S18b, mitochondrial [Nothoprocta perdicaria]